ncbi:MAG: hypothetical protein L0338_05445, partial [Acidobacteria bacterium]|nr:hypothetical protein [Acidobacteriota bacterium]
SSFTFKDKPRNIREVGQQLKTNLVVEGSVLRAGGRLRINAQLVRVADDEKIRRTIHGKAKVVIDNARCQYVTIHSEVPVRWLLSMAKVAEWRQLQCLWIPNDFLLGRLGQCRLMAGMRESRTIVDQDAVWFEGSDGCSNQFVSVRLGRDWLKRELGQSS